MILVILILLVIFIKLYRYKYETFEGNCIKPIEDHLTFSLTKNKLKQIFYKYGNDDHHVQNIIKFYAQRDLSDNVNIENIFYDVSNEPIDPLNDHNNQLLSINTCELEYL